MVWNFCEGWKPEAIGIAFAYVGVRDVGPVMDCLVILRGVIAERRAAEEGTKRAKR